MTADDVTARPSRPLRADARRNYDAILTAARAAFARSGVSASLDEIARSAGVGPGTLYRRFPTREDLLAAALADNMRVVGERGRALSSADSTGPSGAPVDPFEALTEWLGLLVDQISTYGGLPDTVLDAARHGSSALGSDCDTMTELTGALLDQAKAAGAVRPDVTRDELFDLASAIAWIATRESPAGARVPRLLDLALHGVAAGPLRATA